MTPIRMEAAAYGVLLVASFMAAAVWESLRQKRPLVGTAERRWANHGILLVVSSILSGVLLRISPVVLAQMVADSRFGVLNKAWLPYPIRFVTGILLLDLVRYTTHWSYHHVPWLWRVHQVHHSDSEYDVSTAARFHPLEAVLTKGAYMAVVAVFAPPAAAVLVAALLTVAIDFFVHANASLPPWAENLMRTVFVTPDLHRIHHSIDMREQQTNLGQTFAWWDRLFGTYTAQPAGGQENLITGLRGVEAGDNLGLGFMLTEPFLPAANQPRQ